MIRENPASRGTEALLITYSWEDKGCEEPTRSCCKRRINEILPLPQILKRVGMDVKKKRHMQLVVASCHSYTRAARRHSMGLPHTPP